MKLKRSFLFVPANNERVVHKALHSEADAVILDFEDAVAISDKENARRVFASAIKGTRNKSCYVRINSVGTFWWEADLEAAIAAEVDGIMLPKAEDAEIIRAIAERLPSHYDLLPLIETAKGITNAPEIAGSSIKVSRLAFGALDYALDIGVNYSKTTEWLLYARTHLVIASRTVGIYPPVDTVYPDLNDQEGFGKELEYAKQLGMFGKLAIHPKQLPLIHENYTPTAKEVADALCIIDKFEAAEKLGLASMQIEGKFIDYPVYSRAKRIIDCSLLN